jgi:hypothetical protein
MGTRGHYCEGDRILDDKGYAGSVERVDHVQDARPYDRIFVRFDWQSPSSPPKCVDESKIVHLA